MEGGSGGVWNAPNASIVAGQWYHIAFVLTRVHPMDIISKDI
jgi:hypothetical protein